MLTLSLFLVCVCVCVVHHRSTSWQCHAHRSPLTKIPTSVPRALLDSPGSAGASARGSPLLRRLGAKVGGRRLHGGHKRKNIKSSWRLCPWGFKGSLRCFSPRTGERFLEPREEDLGAAPRLPPEPPRLPRARGELHLHHQLRLHGSSQAHV